MLHRGYELSAARICEISGCAAMTARFVLDRAQVPTVGLCGIVIGGSVLEDSRLGGWAASITAEGDRLSGVRAERSRKQGRMSCYMSRCDRSRVPDTNSSASTHADSQAGGCKTDLKVFCATWPVESRKIVCRKLLTQLVQLTRERSHMSPRIPPSQQPRRSCSSSKGVAQAGV